MESLEDFPDNIKRTFAKYLVSKNIEYYEEDNLLVESCIAGNIKVEIVFFDDLTRNPEVVITSVV